MFRTCNYRGNVRASENENGVGQFYIVSKHWYLKLIKYKEQK